LETPEYDTANVPLIEAPQEPSTDASPGTLAPAWHTGVLIAWILGMSLTGSSRLATLHGTPTRLWTYGITAAMELAMLGWVALGLRLHRIPLRSIFGSIDGGMRAIARDLGIALVFWIGALMVLGTLGIAWAGAEAVIKRAHPAAGQTAPQVSSQRKTARMLAQLAPANAEETVGWALLCMLVGMVEETVFRGYLQRQFSAWARGGAAAGVIFSALIFGAAHGYQGARNMVLLAVFGVLFSLLANFRRSLRAGIFAHSWHDLITGVALGLLKSHHLL